MIQMRKTVVIKRYASNEIVTDSFTLSCDIKRSLHERPGEVYTHVNAAFMLARGSLVSWLEVGSSRWLNAAQQLGC